MQSPPPSDSTLLSQRSVSSGKTTNRFSIALGVFLLIFELGFDHTKHPIIVGYALMAFGTIKATENWIVGFFSRNKMLFQVGPIQIGPIKFGAMRVETTPLSAPPPPEIVTIKTPKNMAEFPDDSSTPSSPISPSSTLSQIESPKSPIKSPEPSPEPTDLG